MVIIFILLILSICINVFLIKKMTSLHYDISRLEFERFVSKINSELEGNGSVDYNDNRDNSKGVLQ